MHIATTISLYSMYDDGAEGGTFITAQGGGGFDQSSAAANR